MRRDDHRAPEAAPSHVRLNAATSETLAQVLHELRAITSEVRTSQADEAPRASSRVREVSFPPLRPALPPRRRTRRAGRFLAATSVVLAAAALAVPFERLLFDAHPELSSAVRIASDWAEGWARPVLARLAGRDDPALEDVMPATEAASLQPAVMVAGADQTSTTSAISGLQGTIAVVPASVQVPAPSDRILQPQASPLADQEPLPQATDSSGSSEAAPIVLPLPPAAALDESLAAKIAAINAAPDPAPSASPPAPPVAEARLDSDAAHKQRTAALGPFTLPPPPTPARTGEKLPVPSISMNPSDRSIDVARLLSRAQALIEEGDISAARLVLERALDAGSLEAAFRLAETYDSRNLAQWNAVGIRGDADRARALYDRASEGGVQGSKERIQGLK